MSNAAPTLINLPPPDPMTPSDAPGTPNSATTSMSELSTIAIKDGHRGHLPHAHHSDQPTPGTLDAERADRISRLAGLERVTTARNPTTPLHNLTPGAVAAPSSVPQGYFDSQGNPALGRERSTVGSASATGSVGGRTTWASASGSDVYDPDKMSESQDMDMDTSSVGAASDNNSLVGFGEGARTPARYSASVGSPSASKATPTVSSFLHQTPQANSYRDTSLTPVSAQAQADQQDVRMVDGMSDERESGDNRGVAERIIRERLGPEDTPKGLESPDSSRGKGDLGKFYFENNK